MGSTSNKYQISSDGVVFYIEDDGTIVRLARITEKGKIEPLRKHGKVDETDLAKSAHSFWNLFFLFFLIAFAAATAALAVLWTDERSEREKLAYDLRNLRLNYSQAESELKERDEKLDATSKKNSDLEVRLAICERKALNPPPKQEDPPRPKETKTDIPAYEAEDDGLFAITSIEVRNTAKDSNVIISDFGENIWSSRAKYLQPRIRYSSRINALKTLDVKFFDANGYLKRGENSKGNYTYSVKDVDIFRSDHGTYLFKTGWGSEGGSWPKGRTRIEIWSDGKFLKATEFEIY